MHRLLDVQVPTRPEAAVLVLHGGAARRDDPSVSPQQLSVLRMIPVARRVARAGRGRLAVLRLLNSHRGWDPEHPPVEDAVRAMAQVRERFGELPLGLVGHSLGGAAAMLAGDRSGVRSVVALNPWLYGNEDVDLRGRSVLVVHGSQDRIAPLDRARQVTERLARRADVELRVVEGGKHAMLRHGRDFEKAAAEHTARVLLADR